jgi:hypothetical protein
MLIVNVYHSNENFEGAVTLDAAMSFILDARQSPHELRALEER